MKASTQMAGSHLPDIGLHHPIDEALDRQGWALVDGAEFALTNTMQRELHALVRACRTLPKEPGEPLGIRRRRLRRYVMLPWSHEVVPRPDSTYFQERERNELDGGATRVFAPFTESMLANPVISALITADYRALPEAVRRRWGISQPIDVGVHAMAYQPRPGCPPAVSTPAGFHNDGEPVTITHLMERDGVDGGESGIAANDGRVLLETTLTKTLDSIFMVDAHVFHRVGPITLSPTRTTGIRSVLLIDFTPYRAQRDPVRPPLPVRTTP